MLRSQLFTKSLKELKEESRNANLLIKGGFIDKLSSGIYSFLPLGLRVYNKVENIIREEMDKTGAQEILMPAVHPKKLWETTGRWEIEEMFKLKGKGDKEYGLGWTHEEVITPLVKKFTESWKDLPIYVYQIQSKMRDEPRPKAGVLRGKEFVMKDLYSFHEDSKDLDRYYEESKTAYFNIFERCGLGNHTHLTLAGGGSFSKFSHEFQTVTPMGEDTIHVCDNCNIAINNEIKPDIDPCPRCNNSNFKEERAIEVGNIFKLGTKYSKSFDFKIKDSKGNEKFVVMGCYGIGVTRLMGAITELYNDDKGIIWPENVAPFDFHIIAVNSGKEEEDRKIKEEGHKVYKALQKQGFDVLYDERDYKSPGEKFAECDLIGIPKRIVVSPKTLEQEGIEIKERKEAEGRIVKKEELIRRYK